MRFDYWKAKLVTTVAIVLAPIPLCAAQPRAMSDWVRKSPATSPTPRRVPSAVAYDSTRGVTVLFGGYDGSQDDETWEWDGVDWTQRIVSPRPSPRVTVAMAYDSARGVTVLFGGVTPTGLSNETWEWDGVNWTLVSSSGPLPRQWHALAYDIARGVTVLFGGNIGGAPGGLPTSDTWEWDGAAWTLLGGTAPPARFGHALAYDTVSDRIIVFGGRDPTVGLYDDTWALGTGGWMLMPTSVPPTPRQAHTMTSAPGGAVLFGGILLSGRSDETFQWNGTDWEFLSAGLSPSARGTHGMAYDSGRGQIVVFGGDDGGSILNDTWEYPVSAPCYADCDQSTGVGVLDIFDFLCFQNSFVNSEPYACDCDTSTGLGVCDIFDFLCFQNAFVAGCP